MGERSCLGEADNYMLLEVPSLAATPPLCRVAVAVFATALPFTLAEIEELKVAISEAVSNSVQHAYPGTCGRITLRASIVHTALIVEVQDWGCGIPDVARARTPAFTTSADPDHIGMGFSFMEQFTDHLDVSSTQGTGTLVRMTKTPHALAASTGE